MSQRGALPALPNQDWLSAARAARTDPSAAGVGTVSTAPLVLITAAAGGDSRAHRRVNVHIPGTS
jgi:hypothetical protein